MLSRFISLTMFLLTLLLSALGVAFGKDKDGQAFLGVVPGEVTSEIADQYGVHPGEGVLVTGISPESPAHSIGLRENDIIISVNSASITGPEEFRNSISKMKPGASVDLVYVRGGKQRDVTVELASRGDREFGFFGSEMPGTPMPPMEPKSPRAPRARVFEWRSERDSDKDSDKEDGDKDHEKIAFAGIITQSLSDGLAEYFKVKEGALIGEVVDDSPADKAGLKAGDVIVKIGDENISDEGDVREVIHDHKPGDSVIFTLMRDGQETTVGVTLGEQDSNDLGELNLENLNEHLKSLQDLPTFAPDSPEMQELQEKLQNLDIQIQGLDPMDIHIDAAPDAPGVHIQNHSVSPVGNQGHFNWRESLHHLRDIVSAEYHQLQNEFARLRDEMVDLGNELMGRTA